MITLYYSHKLLTMGNQSSTTQFNQNQGVINRENSATVLHSAQIDASEKRANLMACNKVNSQDRQELLENLRSPTTNTDSADQRDALEKVCEDARKEGLVECLVVLILEEQYLQVARKFIHWKDYIGGVGIARCVENIHSNGPHNTFTAMKNAINERDVNALIDIMISWGSINDYR